MECHVSQQGAHRNTRVEPMSVSWYSTCGMTHAHTEEQEPKKIVILGAGFGGLSAALELGRMRKKHRGIDDGVEDFDIVLIDRNDFQLFTPDLYEIASASRDITSEEQLKESICLNVRVALGQQSIGFMKAEVTSVDTADRFVHTNKGEVAYDYLICALGSEAFYFGIPGMDENSIALKTIDEAIQVRSEVHSMVEKQDNVHVIICGGGPAGVEVAAEMRVACKNSITEKCPAITIVEGQSSVLAPFGKKAQKRATKQLRSLGVTLKTNFMIAKAEKGKVISKEGEELVGDIIIWTGGVKAHHMAEQLGVTLGKRGQVPVHRTLQSKEREELFAIGDVAEVAMSSEVFCPQTAHEAVAQAPVVARNVFHHLQGHPEKMKEYRMKAVGYVVTLGGKQAIVGMSNGFVFGGFAGWLTRKYVDFLHFRAVLPFMHACSVWYKGLTVMTKND